MKRGASASPEYKHLAFTGKKAFGLYNPTFYIYTNFWSFFLDSWRYPKGCMIPRWFRVRYAELIKIKKMLIIDLGRYLKGPKHDQVEGEFFLHKADTYGQVT